MDAEELSAWLRLLRTPGLGRESIRRLLAAFGSAAAVVRAPRSAQRDVAGPAAATALLQPPDNFDAELAATIAWLADDAEEARAVITLGDERYPAPLLATADPPLALFARGRLELLQAQAVAIVGSRHPTPQGSDNAHAFAEALSKAGHVVVSGMALGVDGAAHEGALKGPSGTIAVVGTGLDRVYPRRHLDLARRIARDGLLLSEYTLGAPPLPQNFPQRNRIIAGLARGTLVVEAALQSGSLITARLALEAGRDVYAIPGSIHSPQARGCHALIKQGAKLVEHVEDVLEELQPLAAPSSRAAAVNAAAPDDASPDPLQEALGYDPVTLDALAARTGWSPAALSARLLELELDGQVARLPGQLFQRVLRG